MKFIVPEFPAIDGLLLYLYKFSKEVNFAIKWSSMKFSFLEISLAKLFGFCG